MVRQAHHVRVIVNDKKTPLPISVYRLPAGPQLQSAQNHLWPPSPLRSIGT